MGPDGGLYPEENPEEDDLPGGGGSYMGEGLP